MGFLVLIVGSDGFRSRLRGLYEISDMFVGAECVLSAVEFEKHAGVTTTNQNNHIFLNSRITLYNLVKELKDSPLHLLGDLIREKIGCPPNLKCFEEWKDSFQMIDDISNTNKNTEKIRPESHSEPHTVEKFVRSFSFDATKCHLSPIDVGIERSVAEGVANLALKAGLTTKFEKAATECCMDPTSIDILNVKSLPRMATACSSSSLLSTYSKVAPSVAVAEGTHFPDSYLVTDGVQRKQNSSLMETASELKTRLPNFLESSAAPVQQETVAHGPQKKRDNSLHRLVFKEGGLPDGTELTYRNKGEILLSGYKQGNSIVCHCHKEEFSPSQFEAHAGMGRRRQPYLNIYTSDGATLHELCQILSKNTKASVGSEDPAIGSEDPCLSCSDGGELVSCDGCHQHFPSAGMWLKDAPNGPHCCSDCFDQSQRALSISSSNAVKPTNLRLRRTIDPEAEDDIHCTICKDDKAILQTKYDGRTITFCGQCGKAYHVGCYARSHPGLKFKEAISDKWFCCTGCSAVCVALEKMPTEGKKVLPDCSSSILKKNFEQRGLQNDTVAAVRWQLLNGKHTKDTSLLKAANKLFQGAFEPIYVGSSELIKQMVYAKEAREAGSVIMSAAILRVHGRCTAELPLVVTRKECQGKGYFQTLLSVIERFLSDLQVKLLITSVDEHTQSMWINKFGFVKVTHEELRMFREHPILNFKETTVLKKAIPNSSAARS
ncbi:Increased DNA methylation 1 [Ananas comosus]|uniref:Increased DNA methylation 1 n=1 Tax=Ananas comosus TaxID=4615 RepID=A0A199VFZ2_ANACO|nr:Increased DNA methylation 1 [Ananas comosus]